MRAQCQGINRFGDQCGRTVPEGKLYCSSHASYAATRVELRGGPLDGERRHLPPLQVDFVWKSPRTGIEYLYLSDGESGEERLQLAAVYPPDGDMYGVPMLGYK